jgi:hypothetical protein
MNGLKKAGTSAPYLFESLEQVRKITHQWLIDKTSIDRTTHWAIYR